MSSDTPTVDPNAGMFEAWQAYFNMTLQLMQQSMAAVGASGQTPEMQWNPQLYQTPDGRWNGGFVPTGRMIPAMAAVNQTFQQNQTQMTAIATLAGQSGRVPSFRINEDGQFEVGVDNSGNIVYDESVGSRAQRFAQQQATGWISSEFLRPPGLAQVNANITRYMRVGPAAPATPTTPATTTTPTAPASPTTQPSADSTAGTQETGSIPTPTPAPTPAPTPVAGLPTPVPGGPTPAGSIGGTPLTEGGQPQVALPGGLTTVVSPSQLESAVSNFNQSATAQAGETVTATPAPSEPSDNRSGQRMGGVVFDDSRGPVAPSTGQPAPAVPAPVVEPEPTNVSNEWMTGEQVYYDENAGKNIRKKSWANVAGETWDTFEDE